MSIKNIFSAHGGNFSLSAQSVEEGLDFILGHLDPNDVIWPRTISTKTTKGRQILVYNKEEALARFKQANCLDCRISAYPSTIYTRRLKQRPNFLFIDLDLQALDLDKELSQTLTNMKLKFENNAIEPTVL
jgi:hypothetical protein